MWELLKRLFVFIIGLYFLMFFIRIIFDGSSLSSTFGGFGKALSDMRSFSQNIASGGSSGTQNASSTTNKNSKYLTSSKGASSAVSFTNLAKGNIVSPKEPILGSIKSSWLYEGVTTARFLDENGNQIGVAQVVEDGLAGPNADQVPFSIYPQFKQGGVKTGYILIEKANNTGKSTNDAWYTLPVTYPTTYTPEDTSSTGSLNSSSGQGGLYNSGWKYIDTTSSTTTNIQNQNNTTQGGAYNSDWF